MHQVTSAQGDAGTPLQLLGKPACAVWAPSVGPFGRQPVGPLTVECAWSMMEDIPGHVSSRGRRSDWLQQELGSWRREACVT